jgi:hypothetical protein
MLFVSSIRWILRNRCTSLASIVFLQISQFLPELKWLSLQIRRHFPLSKNKYVCAGRNFLFISKGLSDLQGATEDETLDDFRLRYGFVSKAPNLSSLGSLS